MPYQKLKGIEIERPGIHAHGQLINHEPSYSSNYSKEAILLNLMGSVANFRNKARYKWHLHLQIETRFNFMNLISVKEELNLQEIIDQKLTSFFISNSNSIKVVSYLQNGFYHYHWYLAPHALDYNSFRNNFEDLMIAYQREIKFMVAKDKSWHNVTINLIKDKQHMSGWLEYLSKY